MADKQKAALNRLAKKLGALRATLSKDERVLLDRIVLGTNEVVGHKATTGAATGPKASNKVNEVAMHGMAGATTGAASGSVSAAKASKKVSEVALHGMTTGAATGAASGSVGASKKSVSGAMGAASGAATGAASGLLEIDATTGGYRVTDGATI